MVARMTALFVMALAGVEASATSVELSSKDLATAGRRTWDAMTCAGYAETAGYDAEQKRLSQLGIDEGRKFLQSLSDGKIDPKDVESNVPIAVTLVIGGPSVDFVLGRIWEASAEYAADRIWQKDSGAYDPAQAPDHAARSLRLRGRITFGMCSAGVLQAGAPGNRAGPERRPRAQPSGRPSITVL